MDACKYLFIEEPVLDISITEVDDGGKNPGLTVSSDCNEVVDSTIEPINSSS
jgi:hypothetical protein